MYNNINNANNKNSNNHNTTRQQILQLNSLSTDELKLKYIELFKVKQAPNYQKGFLIKELAYKIQILQGQSETSQEELNLTLNIARKNIKGIEAEKAKNSKKSIVMLPPTGSVITKIYKGIEHRVKVIADNRFEYNGMIYKSLSSLAHVITGTKWNGYVFFGLKKKVS